MIVVGDNGRHLDIDESKLSPELKSELEKRAEMVTEHRKLGHTIFISMVGLDRCITCDIENQNAKDIEEQQKYVSLARI